MAEYQDKRKEEDSPEEPLRGQKPSRIVHGDEKKKRRKKSTSPPSEDVKITRSDTLVLEPNPIQSLLTQIYQGFYLIGLFVMGRIQFGQKRVRLLLSKTRGGFLALTYRIEEFLRRWYNRFLQGLARPLQQIQNVWRGEKQTATQEGLDAIPPAGYLRVVKKSVGFFWRILRAFLSYLLPVIAVILLISTVSERSSVPQGLQVVYQNEPIGYIKNESDFTLAMESVDKRIASNVDVTFSHKAPEFTLVKITPELMEEVIIPKLEHQVVQDEVRRAKALARTQAQAGAEEGDEPVSIPQITIQKEDIPDLASRVEEKKQALTSEETMQLFFSTQDELADEIILASDNEVVQAYGLYADGVLVGAVEERDTVLDEIEEIQQKNLTGKPDERVEFDKAISYTQGLFPVESVMGEQELIDILYSVEETEKTYIVQVGDTPSEIAKKNYITRARLYELNPDLETNFVEGKELLISSASPFLSVKNIYTDIYDQEAPYRIVENENILYAVGYRQIERPGVPGIDRVKAEITMVNGVEIDREIIESYHIRDPIEELVTIGSKDPRKIESKVAGGVTSTGFIWPAQGGFVGTVLGGYPGHTGVDINNSAGEVIASASGTVVTSVNSYVGYGNYIVIDHGNGFTTLYAHNTRNYVSVGDYVAQGQAIALLGSTGNSTGPHIHFEVKQNGQLLNPTDFIGTRG